MTGQELLERLSKLTPEQLAKPCVTIYTEYADPEDSCGYGVVREIFAIYPDSSAIIGGREYEPVLQLA